VRFHQKYFDRIPKLQQFDSISQTFKFPLAISADHNKFNI